jgi:hypothetical protein
MEIYFFGFKSPTLTEFMDPVSPKTSPKRSVSVKQNERFGLVFAKTGSSTHLEPIDVEPDIPGLRVDSHLYNNSKNGKLSYIFTIHTKGIYIIHMNVLAGFSRATHPSF